MLRADVDKGCHLPHLLPSLQSSTFRGRRQVNAGRHLVQAQENSGLEHNTPEHVGNEEDSEARQLLLHVRLNVVFDDVVVQRVEGHSDEQGTRDEHHCDRRASCVRAGSRAHQGVRGDAPQQRHDHRHHPQPCVRVLRHVFQETDVVVLRPQRQLAAALRRPPHCDPGAEHGGAQRKGTARKLDEKPVPQRDDLRVTVLQRQPAVVLPRVGTERSLTHGFERRFRKDPRSPHLFLVVLPVEVAAGAGERSAHQKREEDDGAPLPRRKQVPHPGRVRQGCRVAEARVADVAAAGGRVGVRKHKPAAEPCTDAPQGFARVRGQRRALGAGGRVEDAFAVRAEARVVARLQRHRRHADAVLAHRAYLRDGGDDLRTPRGPHSGDAGSGKAAKEEAHRPWRCHVCVAGQ
eukprot:Rhum_TRINITY_DN8228_c0_g1::Rhum_TRINITY_DN8228_c0_g1_i1::g.26848::m.26848